MAVEAVCQLTATELEALATLEDRVVSADGGRLKLEWGVLRSRSGDVTRDFVWREDGMLLGFLGLYSFGAQRVEIAGMVDPAARRRGIFTALLNCALPICAEQGDGSALMVVPRNSEPGHALALCRGATLEHSEHALILSSRPLSTPLRPLLSVRLARPADFGAVSRLLLSGFGHEASHPDGFDATAHSYTLVAERNGTVVGTLRVTLDQRGGSVYGFAIDPQLRGQGLGRELLSRACGRLFDAGAETVGLEVATDNDRALRLYTSLGFAPIATEDYYELAL